VSYAQERLAQIGGEKPRRNQYRGKTAHLTRDDFRLIRELARFIPQAEIARKFETSATHVSRIVKCQAPEPLR
jgi:hypothetical protein